MFTAEGIKERVRVQPFVPFRVVSSSGESYEVRLPDLIWIGARELHIGMGSKKKPTLYEKVARVSILHITALEDLPMKPSAKTNGEK